MPKLQKPASKVNQKELEKKLAVATEPAAPEKKKLGRPPKAKTEPVQEVVAPAPAPAKSKVSSIADKKAAKNATPPVTPAPAAKPKLQKPATPPPAPPAQEVEEDNSLAEWEETFDALIEGKNYRYVRQDSMTLAEMQKNLPKFNVHMLMAEERADGKFTNMVLCFVSHDTFTFIDQTGDEDMDSLIQVKHDEVIGKRELKAKKHTFPFALYLKEAKATSKGK